MHNSGSTEVPVLIKQILLVEDETIFANAIKKHLVRKGYKVDLASDLKSARLLMGPGVDTNPAGVA